MPIRQWTSALLIGTVGAGLIGVAALAGDATPPSKDTGHALARALCSTCHLIGDDEGMTATAGIPTFRIIANREGQSAERILRILMQPHAPMPDMQLTMSEMQSLLAYLESLRTNPKVPPLTPPPAGGKLTYPEPS